MCTILVFPSLKVRPWVQPFGDSGFDFLRLPLAVADCDQVVRVRITIVSPV